MLSDSTPPVSARSNAAAAPARGSRGVRRSALGPDRVVPLSTIPSYPGSQRPSGRGSSDHLDRVGLTPYAYSVSLHRTLGIGNEPGDPSSGPSQLLIKGRTIWQRRHHARERGGAIKISKNSPQPGDHDEVHRSRPGRLTGTFSGSSASRGSPDSCIWSSRCSGCSPPLRWRASSTWRRCNHGCQHRELVWLFGSSLVGWIVIVVADVAIAVTLYLLLEPVSRAPLARRGRVPPRLRGDPWRRPQPVRRLPVADQCRAGSGSRRTAATDHGPVIPRHVQRRLPPRPRVLRRPPGGAWRSRSIDRTTFPERSASSSLPRAPVTSWTASRPSWPATAAWRARCWLRPPWSASWG